MTAGYGTILRRHLVLVTLVGLVGLLLGAWFNAQQHHYYEASTDVRLSQVASPFRSSDGTKADLSRALQTQIDLATGDQVRERLRGTAGDGVKAHVALNGERDELRFTCKADDARTAADAANAWAAAYVAELQAETDAIVAQYQDALNTQYVKVAKEIESIDAERLTATPAKRSILDLRRDVLVTEIRTLAGRRALDDASVPFLLAGQVVRKSAPPSDPANDQPLRDLLLGLCGGLVLGYVAACLVEARRDQVRSVEDVSLVAPHEPVLGPVPTGTSLAALGQLSADQGYLSLRADALAVAADVQPPVLGVLSTAGEAESAAVALGLALALRRQGQWVLLVDADGDAGANPLLPRDDSPGLAGILFDGAPVAASVSTVQWGDGPELLVLPKGQLSAGRLVAAELGGAVDQLISEHQLDAVIISSGAASGSPDATAVAVVSSALLVVASLRRTRRRHLALALRRLEMLTPKARAVVLARAPRRGKAGHGDTKASPAPARAVSDDAAQARAAEEGVTRAPRGRR